MGIEELLGRPKPVSDPRFGIDPNLMNIGPDPYAGTRPNRDYGPLQVPGSRPLGGLSDVILWLNGGLADRKKEDALRGALQDFDADPQSAIQRAMKIDPELGLKAALNYEKGTTAADVRRAALAGVEDDREFRQKARSGSNLGRLAMVAANAGPDHYAENLRVMRNYAKKHSLNIDEYELPDMWDKDGIAQNSLNRLASLDWTTGQQATDARADQRFPLYERQADQNDRRLAIMENRPAPADKPSLVRNEDGYYYTSTGQKTDMKWPKTIEKRRDFNPGGYKPNGGGTAPKSGDVKWVYNKDGTRTDPATGKTYRRKQRK